MVFRHTSAGQLYMHLMDGYFSYMQGFNEIETKVQKLFNINGI